MAAFASGASAGPGRGAALTGCSRRSSATTSGSAAADTAVRAGAPADAHAAPALTAHSPTTVCRLRAAATRDQAEDHQGGADHREM
jgi:hypothetical protein